MVFREQQKKKTFLINSVAPKSTKDSKFVFNTNSNQQRFIINSNYKLAVTKKIKSLHRNSDIHR